MVKRTVSACAGLMLVAAATVAGAQQPRVMVRSNMGPAVMRGAPGAVVEVRPEQLAQQRAYEARTDAHIREIIHQDKKQVTDDERKFIDEHWRRTARLWRIRQLAENAGDTASVARCDALLKRADVVLDEQIKHFRDRAPVIVVK